MRTLLSSVVTVFIMLSAPMAHAAQSLMIHNAWIPEMPPVSSVHAGFASFHNMTDNDIEIVKISSPSYRAIEMHLSKEVDGMARMIPQKSLIVQANKMLVLQHGSYHLMMFRPQSALKKDDKVELTLTFANGEQQSFTATVQKSAESMEHHHHH